MAEQKGRGMAQIKYVLVFVFLFILLSVSQSYASNKWWNTSWHARKNITITSHNESGVSILEPISIYTYNDSDISADPNYPVDIRIATEGGQEIPYMFTNISGNNTQGVIFLANSTSAGTTYYIYYDGPNETANYSCTLGTWSPCWVNDTTRSLFNFRENFENKVDDWTSVNSAKHICKLIGGYYSGKYSLNVFPTSSGGDMGAYRTIAKISGGRIAYVSFDVMFDGTSAVWFDIDSTDAPNEVGGYVFAARNNGSKRLGTLDGNGYHYYYSSATLNKWYRENYRINLAAKNFDVSLFDNTESVGRNPKGDGTSLQSVSLWGNREDDHDNISIDNILISTNEFHTYNTTSSYLLEPEEKNIIVTLISPLNNSYVNLSRPVVNFKVTDLKFKTIQVTLYFNGTNVSYNRSVINNTNTSLVVSNNLTDGLYTFWLFVNDSNSISASSNYTLSIDTISPTISEMSANTTSTNSTISLWGEVNDTHINNSHILFKILNISNTSLVISSSPANCSNLGNMWNCSLVWNGTKNASQGNYTFSIIAYDIAGNHNETVFNDWFVFDNLAPYIVSTVPNDGETGVVRDDAISITFNEKVNGDAINNTTLYINKTSDGTSIPSKVSTNDNITFRIKPESDLSYNTMYTVTLKAGVSDLLGNVMTHNYSFRFTTKTESSSESSGGGGSGGGGVFLGYPPKIEDIPNQVATVGQPFELLITATDKDNGTLQFSDDSNLFNIGTYSGKIYFIPTEDQTGTYNITITVNDGKLSTHKIFTLTINPAPKEENKTNIASTKINNSPSDRKLTTESKSKSTSPTGFLIFKQKGGSLGVAISAILIVSLLVYVFRKPTIQISRPKFSKIRLAKKLISMKKLSVRKPVVSQPIINTRTPLVKPLEITPRMHAILSALHYREKEILETLIKLGGKTTQARVYHETRMPTTTLSRWVDSLERRGLVKTNYYGKLREIELTEKFLRG